MKVKLFIALLLSGITIAQELPQKLEFTGNIYQDSKMIAANMPANQETHTIMLPTQEKKSPLLAGVLSAVLPGAGQYYNDNYLMMGVFALIEAGAVATAVVYDKKGDDKEAEYQKVADSRWSVVKYAQWINEHKIKGSSYESYMISINNDASLSPWQRVNWEQLNAAEEKVDGFSHKLAKHGEQQYYEMIGKYNQFTAGWDEFDITNANNTELPPIYTSYSQMRGKANDYYNISYKTIIAIYLNHIASAVQSIWETVNYNKSLQISSEVYPRTVLGATEIEASLNIKYSF